MTEKAPRWVRPGIILALALLTAICSWVEVHAQFRPPAPRGPVMPRGPVIPPVQPPIVQPPIIQPPPVAQPQLPPGGIQGMPQPNGLQGTPMGPPNNFEGMPVPQPPGGLQGMPGQPPGGLGGGMPMPNGGNMGGFNPGMQTPEIQVRRIWQCKSCGHTWDVPLNSPTPTQCPHCGAHFSEIQFQDGTSIHNTDPNGWSTSPHSSGGVDAARGLTILGLALGALLFIGVVVGVIVFISKQMSEPPRKRRRRNLGYDSDF
jgi:hypothetical protein